MHSHAQEHFCAWLLAALCGDIYGMSDWARQYILHVLETRDWSANRLAQEAKVAASTINRPLYNKDWPFQLSRGTIEKVRAASGIDPTPFMPEGFGESSAPEYAAPAPHGDDPEMNTVRLSIDGGVARLEAVVDTNGIARLRRAIEAIELALSDD